MPKLDAKARTRLAGLSEREPAAAVGPLLKKLKSDDDDPSDVGSCSPRTKAESILRDLHDDEGPRSLCAIAACTATKHNGCAALAERAGDTYVRTDTECRPRCAGDVYAACDDGVLARRDCAARGLVASRTRAGGRRPATHGTCTRWTTAGWGARFLPSSSSSRARCASSQA